MKEGFWTVFCGDTECSSNDVMKKCSSSFYALISSYSCSNHILIISIDVLIWFIVLSIFIYKLVSRKLVIPSRSQRFSPLPYVSAIFNGILGLAYSGTGILIIVEKLGRDQNILPIHGWLVMLFQGFTWLLLILTVSLKKLFLTHVAAVKFCLILTFLLSAFLCISSVCESIADKAVSIQLVLYILSVPGAVLFLFCSFQGQIHASIDPDVRNDASYEPLPGKEANASSESISNDDVTPFAKAGIFSQLSFWWLNPLMKKGKAKILNDEDIPLLRQEDRAKNRYLMYMEKVRKQKQTGSSDSHSMISVIISLHWKEILISGFFALIKVLTLSTGPLFLKAFIEVAEGKSAFKYEGYALTLGLFLAKCFESLSERQWRFRTRLIGVQVRSLLSAAVYKKQLRLSNAAMTTHSAGEIVNYVTADAYRIGEFPYWFHQIWTTSLQLCLALAIVYYSVGLATVAAIVAVILIVFASSPLVKLQLKYQKKLMMTQDTRLKAITEALANMKVLKLYAWETHFKNFIHGTRKEEFQWISGVVSQKGYQMVLYWSSPVLVPAITFWTCYFLKIPLSAGSIFTFLASLRIVQEPVRLIPDVVGAFIEAKVSLYRIVKFLEAPELQNRNTRQKCSGNELDQSIFISSTEISWDTDPSSKATLRNINLVVKPREKVAICGEVGSGKSTLLAAVLGEVPKINGTVSANKHGVGTFLLS